MVHANTFERTQKLVMFKSFGFAATPFKGLVVCLEEAVAVIS